MSMKMFSFLSQAHVVAVIEKFTVTIILNVVIQLQLEICRSIQSLCKYPTNKINIASLKLHQIHFNINFVKP